jgi:hypothetical protein
LTAWVIDKRLPLPRAVQSETLELKLLLGEIKLTGLFVASEMPIENLAGRLWPVVISIYNFHR